ncbi:MAG: DoxX family protein [Fulvivirga sp.]|nr:DoxX family protein [Fulvivirga sp.]
MTTVKSLYFEAVRIFLGIIFFTAGMSKLMDFPGLIGPRWLEDALAPHGLGLFARFVAFSQIMVGLLLLTRRFATLGAIMLFPLLLCIMMVTISLDWRGTPYVNAFLLILNMSLFIKDYHKLKFIFTDDAESLRSIKPVRRDMKFDFIWLVALVIFFIGLLIIDYTPQHNLLLWTGGLTFFGLEIFRAFTKFRHQKK